MNNIPENISSISAGGGHTIIIDDSCDLWSSGWNNKGQLGIGSTNDSSSFIKLNFNYKFRCVACGWDTSAGITFDDRLFVWGSNNQDQLGFSRTQYKVILAPTELKLPSNERVVDIQFGLRHSVILTKSNQLYIIGSLKHFKSVNHHIVNHNSIEYLKVVVNSTISQIVSGQNHVAFHDGAKSICGIGDNKFKQSADLKLDERIVKMSSGWTHNAVLTESRELFLYGRNNYGQLGNACRSDYETLQKCRIHPVDDFQLGAEHGILISNGTIYTWGWNEHSNCGNGSMEDV